MAYMVRYQKIWQQLKASQSHPLIGKDYELESEKLPYRLIVSARHWLREEKNCS